MTTVFTQLTLSEMLMETEAVATETQHAFGLLNAQQLNWKPSSESWSVAQCLEHVMANNHLMFRAMDETMTGTNRAGLFERLPVLPSLFGKLMIKVVSPDFKQKLKSPPAGKPSASAIDAHIVNLFIAHQHDIAERIREVERLGAAQIVMTSPFVGWITYSLIDACRLIAAHERRHLGQAQRVLATLGFPG